jgi:hypothetical protein
MAIKFSCPSCKKALAVKDELAGKRGRCPHCKQAIAIPQVDSTVPSAPAKARPADGQQPKAPRPPARQASVNAAGPSPQAADLEALAAELLAHKPEAEAAPPQNVTFTCPWCDTQVTYPAELAGKQAPCTNPECRRIIKVPALQKTAPRDWRQPEASSLPAGARRDDKPLEGAWGSQSATAASRQALIQAKVIREEKEPLGVRGWLIRGLAAAAVVLAVAGGVGYFFSVRTGWVQLTALSLSALDLGQTSEPVEAEDRFWLALGMAEYELRRAGESEEARLRGLARLQEAKAALAALPPNSAGYLLGLRELLVLHQRLLAGQSGEGEQELASSFLEVLAMLPTDLAGRGVLRDAFREALRADPAQAADRARRWAAFVQQSIRPSARTRPEAPAGTGAEEDRGRQPAREELQYSEQLDALAVLGQELHRLGHPEPARDILGPVYRLHRPDHPVPIEAVALAHALGLAEPEGLREEEPVHLARFLGQVRAGKIAEAGEFLQGPLRASTSPQKVCALLDACECALEAHPEWSRGLLNEAADILTGYARNDLVWQRIRLLRLHAHVAGQAAAEAAMAQYLDEPDVGYARVELLWQSSRSDSQQKLALPEDLSQRSPAPASLGRLVMLLARHNARLDPSGTLNWVQGLPSRKLQAYGGSGVVLGMQDAGHR